MRQKGGHDKATRILTCVAFIQIFLSSWTDSHIFFMSVPFAFRLPNAFMQLRE